MANCEVRVDVAASALAGETVSGAVVTTCEELVETKAVSLRIGWRTHGRGNTNSAIVYEQVLFSGHLSGEQRFAFSL